MLIDQLFGGRPRKILSFLADWRNSEKNMIFTLLFQFHFIFTFHLIYFDISLFLLEIFTSCGVVLTVCIWSVLFFLCSLSHCLKRVYSAPVADGRAKFDAMFCLLVTQLPCREQKHWCRKPCSCVSVCAHVYVFVCVGKTPPTDTQPPALRCSYSCLQTQ